MKELKKLYQDGKEQHAEKQFEKKSILLGSKSLRPGHRCFEINNETQECNEATYQSEVHFNKPNTRKISVKKNHYYINALNAKNALKVFKRSYKKVD